MSDHRIYTLSQVSPHGFLTVAAVHFALKYLVRTPDTRLSDRIYLDRFIFSFGLSLVLLAVIRLVLRLNKIRDQTVKADT